MTRSKRRYLRKKEADALGLTNLSGHKKGDQVFLRYQINVTTGHIEAKYMSIAARKKSNRKNARKKYNFITRYKRMVGCKFCGYKENVLALQFDHINPKEKSFSLSQGYRSKGMDKLKKEIRKCQVLCANCHAIKTYENGDYIEGQNRDD